jgi:hypothetical protein
MNCIFLIEFEYIFYYFKLTILHICLKRIFNII